MNKSMGRLLTPDGEQTGCKLEENVGQLSVWIGVWFDPKWIYKYLKLSKSE